MKTQIEEMREQHRNYEKMNNQLKAETREMIGCFTANDARSPESKELFSKFLAEMGRDYEGSKRVLNLLKRVDNDYLEVS